MTSDQYKWSQSTRFDGGIQVQPEVAQPNQVIDASNYWTPLSRCDRRPGIESAVGIAPALASVSPPIIYSAATLFLNGISVSGTQAVSVGDVLVPSGYSPPDPTSGGTPVYQIGFGWGSLPANTWVIVDFQIYTNRGWIGVSGQSDFGGGLHPFFGGKFVTTTASYQLLNFVPPTDWKLDPVTSGLWRLVITGLYNTNTRAFTSSGSAGTVLTALGVTLVGSSYIQTTPITTSVLSNAFRLEYASGTVLETVAALNPPGHHYIRITGNIGMLDDRSAGDSSFDYAAAPPLAVPATVAVIPEFNTAYIAQSNVVYECPYNQTPLIAQVNSDPLIVGPTNIAQATTSIYPSDQIPQLNSFPATNLVVYFHDRLWAAGLAGQPNTIRWGAAASTINGPAYNVWPAASMAQISTAQDNSPITAIAPLADNLVIFKKNSIWLMIDNGVDPLSNLPLFEPRLVVAGVGCLANNSVKAIPGGLMFLAEDGFYLFDGTPNIKRMSDPIKTYINRISPARAPFAQAVNWRTQQCYLCAVSLDGEMNSNNYVFLYDYQSNAWWVWTGWDVQCWYQDDGVGLREEIWFFDRYGRASKLGAGDTDNGTPIQSFLTTHRFGEFDLLARGVCEVRSQSCNQADILAPATLSVITEDILTTEGTDKSVTYPLDGETLWADPPVSGTSTWVPDRRRERKTPFKVTGKWFQIKIKNALQVIMLAAGWSPDSRR